MNTLNTNMTNAEYRDMFFTPSYDEDVEGDWVDVTSFSGSLLIAFLLNDDPEKGEYSLDDLFSHYGVETKTEDNNTYALYKIGETYVRGEWNTGKMETATFLEVIPNTDPDWVFWEEK